MAWPTHDDGSNKKIGEMTKAEQREVWKAAGKRLQAEFERPDVQENLNRILDGKPVH